MTSAPAFLHDLRLTTMPLYKIHATWLDARSHHEVFMTEVEEEMLLSFQSRVVRATNMPHQAGINQHHVLPEANISAKSLAME